MRRIEEEFNKILENSKFVSKEEAKHVYYMGAYFAFIAVEESLLDNKPEQFNELRNDMQKYFKEIK